MIMLTQRSGDPVSIDLRKPRPHPRFSLGPSTHYQVRPLTAGWGLYKVRIDHTRATLKRRTEKLLAAYAAEQDAEAVALAMLGLDQEEKEDHHQRGRHNKGKMILFAKETA